MLYLPTVTLLPAPEGVTVGGDICIGEKYSTELIGGDMENDSPPGGRGRSRAGATLGLVL